MLSDVVGGLMLSSDNPLDFHSEMYLVLAIILTYLCNGCPKKNNKRFLVAFSNSFLIDSFFVFFSTILPSRLDSLVLISATLML